MRTQNSLLQTIAQPSPTRDYILCSTDEKKDGHVRKFLILRERGQLYIRNWLEDSWVEIKDELQLKNYEGMFSSAMIDKRMDCLSAR